MGENRAISEIVLTEKETHEGPWAGISDEKDLGLFAEGRES
jgi:hypothetical protein